MWIILLGFTLTLIVIIFGNYIHIEQTKKDINYERQGVYLEYENKNLVILIDVDTKLLYLIDLNTNEILKEYAVATGKPSTPTPIGTFKIAEKGRWGGGFGSRWLGLDVPWGKFGIHGTNKPQSIGYNASQGCIRMRNKDVEELYSIVDYETSVTIINGSYGPFANGFRAIKPGHRGADVQEVQKRLKQRGYYEGTIDGIYGDGMKAALIEFFRDNNMPITDSIGYEVYKKLDIFLID